MKFENSKMLLIFSRSVAARSESSRLQDLGHSATANLLDEGPWHNRPVVTADWRDRSCSSPSLIMQLLTNGVSAWEPVPKADTLSSWFNI